MKKNLITVISSQGENNENEIAYQLRKQCVL